jgi:GGDEF domain-containing protein
MIFIITTIAALAVAYHYWQLSQSLMQCPVFGCLTRQGIERRRRKVGNAVVFADIDKMKEANSLWGYEETNRRIAAAIADLRGDLVMGRWFSGDEFVISCNGQDGDALCQRIQDVFAAQGLSITCAWALSTAAPLQQQVDALSKIVAQAKEQR